MKKAIEYFKLKGGCTCGAVRYQLAEPPMFVNCCHCSWCQRETGSAFAINAIIEMDRLQVTGQVALTRLPSASGKGQEVARCLSCGVTLWSHYAGVGRLAAFVRVGTMDDPSACSPDAHIFTSTRLPWVVLDSRVPVFAEYYDLRAIWPEPAQARRAAMKLRAAGA